jgi:hypothetical membrane protein
MLSDEFTSFRYLTLPYAHFKNVGSHVVNMKIRGNRIAGFLIALGMAQFIMFMILSEILYPHYSVSTNYISDLGVGSTAPIFNTSIMLLGVMLVLAAVVSWKTLNFRSMSLLIAIVGIAAFGVGACPETTGIFHYAFAAVAFGGGGITAINSARMMKGPIRYLAVLLGMITLVAFFIAVAFHTTLGLGNGGMERMIAYPVFIWTLLFGGYLLNSKK